MISVVLAASTGWVTISQSRHGAQLNTIKSQMAGEQLDYGPMVQQTLGYLWDLPASSTSTRGLGGGITWAWDPDAVRRPPAAVPRGLLLHRVHLAAAT